MSSKAERVDILIHHLEKNVIAPAKDSSYPFLVVKTCELFYETLGPELAIKWGPRLELLFKGEENVVRRITELYFALLGMRTKFYKK